MSIAADLTHDERALLRALSTDMKLERGATEGKPFHLAYTSGADRELRFSQELVYGLIDRGLLRVTQRAYAFEDRSWPTGTPFSCVLTKEGQIARATVWAETPRRLAA